MDIPNDIFLGPIWYLDHPILLVFLLLSVSHLVLPLLARLSGGSHLSEKNPNHLRFKDDIAYHWIWLGLIPATIMLIHRFHRWAYEFAENNLGDCLRYYKNEFIGNMNILVVSLFIALIISFLFYRVNRNVYIKAGVTTWWFPNPGGSPAPVTIAFQIWSAIIASSVLVYMVHHIVIALNLHGVFGGWTHEVMKNMGQTPIKEKFDEIIKYFSLFIIPLLPGVALCCIVIGTRIANLKAKITDPVIILNFVGISLFLLLLYVIPLVATGFLSTLSQAEGHYGKLV